MNIKGKIVTLRAVELEDMELLRGMLNDPEMEKAVVGWSFPVSKYSQQKWYNRQQEIKKIRDMLQKQMKMGQLVLLHYMILTGKIEGQLMASNWRIKKEEQKELAQIPLWRL